MSQANQNVRRDEQFAAKIVPLSGESGSSTILDVLLLYRGEVKEALLKGSTVKALYSLFYSEGKIAPCSQYHSFSRALREFRLMVGLSESQAGLRTDLRKKGTGTGEKGTTGEPKNIPAILPKVRTGDLPVPTNTMPESTLRTLHQVALARANGELET